MAKIYLTSDLEFEDVISLPLLEIQYLPTDIDLLKYDFLLFTSKNGIKAIDSFNKTWKEIPSISIASKTSQIVKRYEGIDYYTSKSSNGNDFANEIKSFLKNKKVLYIRAKKTLSNLTNILKESNVLVDELIAYETTCNNKINKKILEKNSIIIFSSPSSINCFFKKYNWDDSFSAIAIGDTTKRALPNNVTTYKSETTSIESCVNLAKKLINNNII